jgi:copper chaperone CopZ
MRILFFTLLTALITFTSPAFANHEGHNHSDMTKEDMQKTMPGVKNADHTITVQIDGLVCDFCARALEKVFGKRQEVSGIDVNLDTKLVTIGIKKGADIDDVTITKLITDAGYNVVKINR